MYYLQTSQTLVVFIRQLFIRRSDTPEETGKQEEAKEGAVHSLLLHPHRVQTGLVRSSSDSCVQC